jgi:hypothetical protein
MNIARSILGGDLERIAREETGFVGDPRIDWRTQKEADFTFKNGMSWADMAERERELRRLNFEDEAVKDLAGNPPDDAGDEKEIINGVTKTKKTIKSLSGRRMRYARYHAWYAKLASELSSLEAKKVELEAIVAAPVEAEGAARNGIRRTAAFLLGRGNGSGEGEAEVAAAKLAIAQHRAEAATVALSELEWEIDPFRVGMGN